MITMEEERYMGEINEKLVKLCFTTKRTMLSTVDYGEVANRS